jgi:hypothetical protein
MFTESQARSDAIRVPTVSGVMVQALFDPIGSGLVV